MSKLLSPIAKTFNLPKSCSYVVFMSFLSGYPIGAKLTLDCYENNLISDNDVIPLLSIASTSGPVFVIGTVGSMLFDNVKIGIICYVSHIIGALINGILYKNNNYKTDENGYVKLVKYDNVLKDSVYNSVISVLTVGGFIAISSFIIDILNDIKLTNILSKPIENIFGYSNISIETAKGFTMALFEITKGLKVISTTNVSIYVIIPLATFLISFGGLTIILQCFSFVEKLKIKFSAFIKIKTTQAIISTCVAIVLTSIFYSIL